MARKFGEAFVEITADSRPLRKGLNDAVLDVEQSVSRIGTAFANIQRFAALYLGAHVFKDLIKGAYEYQNQLTRLGNVLRLSMGSDVARESLGAIREEAIRLGYSIPQLGEQFRQLVASTRGVGVQFETVKELFTAVTEAGRVLGLSQEQLSRAFTALSQVASKGKISMEEIRGQLGEALPGAVALSAKALGVHISQLEQAAKGYTDMDAFLKNLAAAVRDEYAAAVSQSVDNIDASLTRLSNAWQAFSSAFIASETDWRDLGRLINAVAGYLMDLAGSAEKAGQVGNTMIGQLVSGFYQLQSYIINISAYFDKLGELVKAKFSEIGNYALKIFTNIGDPEELRRQSERTAQLRQELLAINEAGAAARESILSQGYALDDNEKKMRGMADAAARSRQIQDQLAVSHHKAAEAAIRHSSAAGKLKEDINQLDEITRVYTLSLGQLEQKWQSARRSGDWGMDAGIFIGLGSREQLTQYQETLAQARKEFADASDKAKAEELQKHQHFLERIHDATADAIYSLFDGGMRSFSDFLSRLKDLFLRFLAEIAAKAIATPIILPIVTSITGAIPGLSYGASRAPGGGSIPGLSLAGSWESIGYSIYGYGGMFDKVGEYLVNNSQFLGQLTTGVGAILAGYGAYTNFRQGGLGGYLGGGLQAAGAGMMGAAALGIGASWLGPVGIALGLGGGIIGSLFGGRKKDDTDLFFRLGRQSVYDELTEAADREERYGGLIAVNVRRGDYLKKGQASELEKQIADYYDNWLRTMDKTVAESIVAAIEKSPVDLHINNLQKLLESGGLDAVIGKINEAIFAAIGNTIKEGVVSGLAKDYQDYWKYMQGSVVEEWYKGLTGASSMEELATRATNVAETMQKVAAAIDALNAVAAGDDLAIYSKQVDAINQKYDTMKEELEALGVAVETTNLELARQTELQRQASRVLQEAYGSLSGLHGLSPQQSWAFTASALSAKYGTTVTPEMVQGVISALANANEEYIHEVTQWLDTLGISFSEFVGDVNSAASALDNLKNSAKQYADAIMGYGQTIYGITGDPTAALEGYKLKYNIPGWTASDINTIVEQYIKGGPEKQRELAETYAKHMGIDLNNVTAEDWQEYNQFLRDTIDLYNMLNAKQQDAASATDSYSEKLREAERAVNDLISALKRVEKAYADFVYDLRFGDLAPVKSFEQYAQEYGRLMGSASKSAEDYEAYLKFAREYLSAYGIISGSDEGYLAAYNRVMAEAEALKTQTEKNLTLEAMKEVASLLGTGGPLYKVLSNILSAIQNGGNIEIYLDGKLVGAAISQEQDNTTQSTVASSGTSASGSVKSLSSVLSSYVTKAKSMKVFGP